MQCKDIEGILERDGFSPLPDVVRAHASSCTACTNLIADFSAILSVAETLPSEAEPPARVWVALRNQLEAEGIIRKDYIVESAPSSWLQNLASILRGRALATAAVGLVIVAAAVVEIRHGRSGPTSGFESPATNTSGQQIQVPPPITATEPLGITGQTLHQEEQNLWQAMPVDLSNQSSRNRVDVSLEQNLASLNQFIGECRRRLQEDPNDELAREYLAVAYQQKAELLSAMLDRGRSVN